MAIIKTNEKLGPNQFRRGAWDRLEGQEHAKIPQQYNCCVPGSTNSHKCSRAAFWHFCACPVPPNDPKCLCGTDFDPVSHSFWQWPLASFVIESFCWQLTQSDDIWRFSWHPTLPGLVCRFYESPNEPSVRRLHTPDEQLSSLFENCTITMRPFSERRNAGEISKTEEQTRPKNKNVTTMAVLYDKKIGLLYGLIYRSFFTFETVPCRSWEK